MLEWVAAINTNNFSTCEGIRTHEEILCAKSKSTYWIKGPCIDKKIPNYIQSLIFEEIYYLNGEKLYPLDSQVSCALLPEMPWQPLLSHIRPIFPIAIPTTQGPEQKATISLTQSDSIEEATTQIIQNNTLKKYIDHIPKVRMDSLSFCHLDPDTFIVKGPSLLSCPSVRYYSTANILLPCGYTWLPRLKATVIKKWLGIQGNDQVIYFDGKWHHISTNVWKPMTRQAVRQQILIN